MCAMAIYHQLLGGSHRPDPVQERCGKQTNTLPRMTEHPFGPIDARRGSLIDDNLISRRKQLLC
jgi:hypothetical protein